MTKEINDVMVYIVGQQKWVRVHSNTNDLYDPSPTLKLIDESPTILQHKFKKTKSNSPSVKGQNTSFKLGIKTVTASEFPPRQGSFKTVAETAVDFKRKMSVVQ